MNKDTNTLITQAKAGKQEAFTKLYNQYHRLIKYIIFDLVKDDSLTNDLTSVTFTKAFSKIDSYVNPISFEAWLKTIAVNTVIDHVRANKEQQQNYSIDNEESSIQLEDTEIDPETEIIKYESVELLKMALKKLRSKYRNLLEMRYFNGYTYEQLSSLLGIPIGTVKSDLNKAKRKLKQFYQKLSKIN